MTAMQCTPLRHIPSHLSDATVEQISIHLSCSGSLGHNRSLLMHWVHLIGLAGSGGVSIAALAALVHDVIWSNGSGPMVLVKAYQTYIAWVNWCVGTSNAVWLYVPVLHISVLPSSLCI